MNNEALTFAITIVMSRTWCQITISNTSSLIIILIVIVILIVIDNLNHLILSLSQ